MSTSEPLSFEDSRRLTGVNPYFAETGAALETAIGPDIAEHVVQGWFDRVRRTRERLGWPQGSIGARRHASGVSLAFAAPADQLYLATEINEWAWQASLHAAGRGVSSFLQPGHAPLDDEEAALNLLLRLAQHEHRPRLQPLLDGAAAHGIAALLDDDEFSLGMGEGSRTWPIDEMPLPEDVPWPQLHDIPVVLVTGSNGKTTTVRLLSAMAAENGWRTAHSCTDGIYEQGQLLDGGDYSGPGGARALLRRPLVQAAILETARGGMLRRGLAISHAPVAVVTNVSPDHYGEYGIHDLSDLADVKLTVARVVANDGVLVLNADDALLRQRATGLSVPLAWFAFDDSHPLLQQAREHGSRTCAVDAGGRLRLFDGRNHTHDLGAIADMPITLGGGAHYNIANAAAAALAACALGIAPTIIAAVLARFGRSHQDNLGRLQHWSFAGLRVFVDYAHNPDGLAGLLRTALHGRAGDGRLALLLGQAGNRRDAEIADLARTAAPFQPDLIVLKEMEGYERGRQSGEVPAILRAALVEAGVPNHALAECLDEIQAARMVLGWARPGDVLVLPIHNLEVRDKVSRLLDRLEADGWQPGAPLPEPDNDALS